VVIAVFAMDEDLLKLAISSGLLLGSKDLIKEIYGDLAKPGVAQVGKAIGNLIGIVLTPLNWSHDKVQMAATANLEKITGRGSKARQKKT
jgi:hypothetical protein